MSFRCEFCKEKQPDRERPVRVVTKVRVRERDDLNYYFGWQIAQEKNACVPCADMVSPPDRADCRPSEHLVISESAAKEIAGHYFNLEARQKRLTEKLAEHANR